MKSRALQALTLGLVLVVLLVVYVRLRLLSLPLERDEGEFAYAGQLMLQGVPPYKLAFNIKLPGTYAAYAVMMALFGQTMTGIHFGFLLVSLATLALLFLIARRLLDVESAAIACICYALFSLSPGVLGFVGHATHLVVLTALGGWWLLMKARVSRRAWSFWWSGILFGLSFLCKQPGLFFAMFGGAMLLRDATAGPPVKRAMRLRPLAIFVIGASLPFLATCLWMWCAGTFPRFWFWTMIYAPYHAGNLSEEQFWWALNDFSRYGTALEWWALLALAGLICLLVAKERSEAKFVLVALLGFSLMALLVSFYLFRHYFIVLLPVASLLIAFAVRSVARWVGWAVAGGCFAIACAAFVCVNRSIWLQISPEDISKSLYQSEPFTEALEIGHYIREHSSPKDSMEVLGSEPEIYFYAQRHSVSGYLYMYDLTKSTPFASAMQKELRHDIETAKPLYLVDVHVPTSWNISRNSDPEFTQWCSQYEQDYYDLTGKVVPANRDGSEYFWGPDAKSKLKDPWMYVAIFRRKPDK